MSLNPNNFPNGKSLYFLQRGAHSGEAAKTVFGIAAGADGLERMTIEQFAEAQGTNLLDSEVRNRVYVDAENSLLTIVSDRDVDTTEFINDLGATFPDTYSGFDINNVGKNVVCKYD